MGRDVGRSVSGLGTSAWFGRALESQFAFFHEILDTDDINKPVKIVLLSFYLDVIDTFQCSKHDAAVLQPLKKYVT